MHILQTPDTFTLTDTKIQTIQTPKMQKIGFAFLAFTCFFSIELPFHKVKDELSTNIKTDANCTNEHLEKLDELKKHKYLSPKYPINVIYIRRISIHDKPNKV